MELTLIGHLLLTIAGIVTAMGASYIIGTRFVAPMVISLIEARYNNDEWLEATMSKSYKMLSKEMMASMKGTAMRDIQTINAALENSEENIVPEDPQFMVTPEMAQFIHTMARKPALGNKLREYIELYAEYGPLLQQMQGNGGRIAGMGTPSTSSTTNYHGSAW